MLPLGIAHGSSVLLQAAPALPRLLGAASRLATSWAGPFAASGLQQQQPEVPHSEKAAVSFFVQEVWHAHSPGVLGMTPW